MSPGQALVVGYGNPLRGDDGVGWHVAARAARDRRLAGATILCRHQLVPELAPEVARARVVVLVDADATTPAGTVAQARVLPARGGRWSHQLDPPALVELAGLLYGAAPPVFSVSIGAACFGYSGEISPPVEAALPVALERLVALAGRPAPNRAGRPS